MNTATTVPSWTARKQSDLVEMETDWRQLDEDEQRAQSNTMPGQIVLAKREKEAEVSRLRAELAVATFVEQFYTAGRTELGERLATHEQAASWNHTIWSQERFERFVRAEVERAARPGVKILGGLPVSVGNPIAHDWWVDLEAVQLYEDREQGWQRYRFQVIGDRVEGWMILDDGSRMAA